MTNSYIQKPNQSIQNKLGTSAKDVSSNVTQFKELANYILWNFDLAFQNPPLIKLAPVIISEIYERIIRFPNENYLLVNLEESIQTDREYILVFKDNKNDHNLPERIVHVPYICKEEDFIIWIKTFHFPFTLLNKSKFQRTAFVQQGKPVFIEIETGHYWYLDNLHKNEYEVFNSNKEHIGTADLNGNLDRSKKVNERKFD